MSKKKQGDEKGVSFRDMCDTIVKADIFERPMTSEEIFSYSPTGELFMIFEWYEIAKKVLKDKE